MRSCEPQGIEHPLALSTNGRNAAPACSEDRTRVGDPESVPERTSKYRAHDARDPVPLYGLDFGPDGRWLVARHDEETMRIWDIETLQLAAALHTPQ